MIILNGVRVETLEQLEEAIVNLTEYEKECLRNDFYGIPNLPYPSIPRVVSPRQMSIALIMSGISLETIETTIDALPEPDKSITRVTWEYSVEFQRDNPVLNAMAPAIGLTQEQIDQLFVLASTL